jgi:hypothetical protein
MSINTFAAPFSSMIGTYKLNYCIGSNNRIVNYCNYNQLQISTEQSSNSNEIYFEFINTNSKVIPLKFGISSQEGTNKHGSIIETYNQTNDTSSDSSTAQLITQDLIYQSQNELTIKANQNKIILKLINNSPEDGVSYRFKIQLTRLPLENKPENH